LVNTVEGKSTELPERAYRSPLRAEQARQTQRRILDAAYGLLLEQGYTATTMAGVAAAAGVSTQTVYKAFGTKPALVKRVYDVTLVGDDEPVPLLDRPEVRALRTETDPRRLLMGYAAVGRGLVERLGPLLRVLLAGARAGDPDLRELVATVNGERLAGATGIVARVREIGPLRAGVSPERARDAVWMLNSVEVWSLLVEQRGWTGAEYAEWVGRAMADAVLPPAE
jgi:AcrR family transcriptional regulator